MVRRRMMLAAAAAGMAGGALVAETARADATHNGATLPGLGLNIARYNLGACSWSSVNGEQMVVSPNIPRLKQIEGFWQDWNNEDPASSDIRVSDKRVSVPFPAASVQTLQIHGVTVQSTATGRSRRPRPDRGGHP